MGTIAIDEFRLASSKLEKAEVIYEVAKKKAFPLGCRVLITHHTGSYEGEIIGHEWRGPRVSVRNDKTGKISKRYPLMNVNGVPCVQRIDE